MSSTDNGWGSGFRLTLPSKTPQDDSTSHSDHQDPISLAVEMAAVNHTILALSRPGAGPGDIKTEALDDD